MVLAVITAVAVIVWLCGLQFLVASARTGQPAEGGLEAGGFAEGAAASGRLLMGTAEVEGQAASLAARAASLLARGTLFPHLPVKIVEKSASHVRFERVEPAAGGQAAGYSLRRGQFSFASQGGGRSRVEWVVELDDLRSLLRVGGGFQVAGLIAIVVGCWAILTWIVPSPDPAVRWQTVQMLQVSHFLWPPFLFGALYRRARREVAARLEALAHNLPYLGDEA